MELQKEISSLTQSNQTVNEQLQFQLQIVVEKKSEMNLLNQQSNDYITEIETLKMDKVCLQRQLKEQEDDYQLLKTQKLFLEENCKSTKQKLDKSEEKKKKYKKAAHHSLTSAHHAHTAAALFCEPKPQSRQRKSFSDSKKGLCSLPATVQLLNCTHVYRHTFVLAWKISKTGMCMHCHT